MNKSQSQSKSPPKKIVNGGRSVPRNGYLGPVILADTDVDGAVAAALLGVLDPDWADVEIVFIDGRAYDHTEDPDHEQDVKSGSVALDMIVPGLNSLKMSGLSGVFKEKNATVEVEERGSASGAVLEEFATEPWHMDAFGPLVSMLDGADGYGRPWYKFEQKAGVEFGAMLSTRLGQFSLMGVLYAFRKGLYEFNQEERRNKRRNTNKATSDLVRWWLKGYQLCWTGATEKALFNWPRVLEGYAGKCGRTDGFEALKGFVRRMGRDGSDNPLAIYLEEVGIRLPEDMMREMGHLTWTSFFEFVRIGIEREAFESGRELDSDAIIEDAFTCFLRGHVSIIDEREQCRKDLFAASQRPGSDPQIRVSRDRRSVLLQGLRGSYQDVAFEFGALIVVSVREGDASITRSKWSPDVRIDSEELLGYLWNLAEQLGGEVYYESWHAVAKGCGSIVGNDPGIMLAMARRAVGLD